MILIVWDTRGDGHDLAYWGRGDWTGDVDRARDYSRPIQATHLERDLRAARDAVRDEARDNVDVQEIV